ncbi:MAG: type II secretion system protein N [Ramlibacter sp.]|nr:type II secretion system protein N [Ramlibacter sp.]
MADPGARECPGPARRSPAHAQRCRSVGRLAGAVAARALSRTPHAVARRPSRHTPAAGPSAPWGWALGGSLLGLALALLLFAPASWLASAVLRASHGQLVLAEPRGTVWNGSARLILTGGEGSNDASALPGRVNWQLRPALNGLSARFAADCCTPTPLALRVALHLRGATLRMEDQRSLWPAALLAGLGTPWNTLQLEGELGLTTQGLSVEWAEGRLALAGRAELDAARISSRLSTLRPMGSYRITLNGGSVSTLQLDTLEGALQLTGSGQWVGSRLRFKGSASAAPDREAALSNLLNIIGRRSGPRSLITIG